MAARILHPSGEANVVRQRRMRTGFRVFAFGRDSNILPTPSEQHWLTFESADFLHHAGSWPTAFIWGGRGA